MDIIIGRNDSDGRLLLTVDGNDQLAATPGSVPPSVGTTHCTLTINNGQMRLKNLDINNYTYINGQSIESKAVTKDDQITLGSDGYLLDSKRCGTTLSSRTSSSRLQSASSTPSVR